MKIASKKEYIILVNANDKKLGTGEKLLVHQYAMLHRAFSVFIFRIRNKKIEFLLHQRSFNKYHSGGLWTNTCCGHQHPGEKLKAAAAKRLRYEMGISSSLKEAGSFHYVAAFKNGLYENEIDSVYVGQYENDHIPVNKTEVAAYRWVDIARLKRDISKKPGKYTPWFKQALAIAYFFVRIKLMD